MMHDAPEELELALANKDTTPPEPRRFKSLEISKALTDEMSACRKASKEYNFLLPKDPFGWLKVFAAYIGITTSMWSIGMLIIRPVRPEATELVSLFFVRLGWNTVVFALVYPALKCIEFSFDWWYGPPEHTRAHYKLFTHLVKRVDAWLEFLLVTRGETVESLGELGQTAERYQTKILALCEEWNAHLAIVAGADVRKTGIHHRIRNTISDDELNELVTITTMLKERGDKQLRKQVSTAVSTNAQGIDLKERMRARVSESDGG